MPIDGSPLQNRDLPTHLVGFVINPIAGMGGRVNLKGTDGVAEEAVRLGARPTAHLRAGDTLVELHRRLEAASPRLDIRWLTCAGAMGAECLRSSGFDEIEISTEIGSVTSATDTVAAVRSFIDRNVEIVLFAGGDGTARDVGSVTGGDTPILGIPSGVKMYSGVFGVTPAATAEILLGFLQGELEAVTADVLDVDEEAYRRGEWAVRLWGSAATPRELSLTPAGKALVAEGRDRDAKSDIAEHVSDEMAASPETLYLLGPGSTLEAVGQRLGLETTLLGIDAVANGDIVDRDLDETRLLALLSRYPRRRLVVSPIGAQGFVLGRGNQQLSPEVLRRIGVDNILVVATPAKIALTPVLRLDTGDASLDRELASPGYLPVVVGYRRRRLVKVQR